MKILKLLRLFVICFLAFSCKKDEVPLDEIIHLRSDMSELSADGTSNATISAYIPIAALPAKRTITFKTYVGTLEDSLNDSQVKKISLKAEKEEGDYWVASVKYTSGLDVKDAIVYASIEGYANSTTVTLNPALPSSIRLTSDGFAVAVNYLGELNLTTTLGSATGKVSKGQRVKFVDTYENSGAPVGGSFRNTTTSDDNSQVKTIYSPGPVNARSYVIIKAIVLDANGAETDLTTNVRIYLKPE